MIIKKQEAMESAILADKMRGLTDAEIGEKYKISYRQLENILRRSLGVCLSSIKHEKVIKSIYPKNFELERTSVWSFKSRGNWATHSGEYRGNWSPYIPRNVILRYTKPGELVLDYFCGAGTTAVEAKLLGRRCIALDINDKAIELAKRNVDFIIPKEQRLYSQIYEPLLLVGDARDLSILNDSSVDLICAHPPYANIIKYTNCKEGDLSSLDVIEFLKEMEKVAKESFRVLKPGHKCAILIGDLRRNKHIVPLGFKLIHTYLEAGFKLKELIIKVQHNCKTTGFWYENSIKYNFLLLAHEYLPIFEKPMEIKEISTETLYEEEVQGLAIKGITKNLVIEDSLNRLETSTVWIFPEKNLEELITINVIKRYSENNSYKIIDLDVVQQERDKKDPKTNFNLLYIKSSCLTCKNFSHKKITEYLNELLNVVYKEVNNLNSNGYCIIQTKDIRLGDYVQPMAKKIIDYIQHPRLILKEIVIVTSKNSKNRTLENLKNLEIVHQYLLIYRIQDEK